MLLAIGVSCHAAAQTAWTWQGFVLHPPGAYLSEGRGAGNRIAAAFVYPGDDPEVSGPVLWRAPMLEQFTLLLPDGASYGQVLGAWGDIQGGNVTTTSTIPAIWYGTRESFVDLLPDGGYHAGTVWDVCGDQQVGDLAVAGRDHAILWLNGDPNAFVDLHPSDAMWSEARATDGVWQGGRVRLSGWSEFPTAALWKSSSTSFVNMHPSTAYDSQINGMAPGVQVGKALIEGILRDHAILWHDTPESWIDMHPPQHPDKNSYMFATTGTMHVGRSNVRAGYWLGDDPASFYDLHQHLPPGASGSNAEDVSVVGDRIYVVGSASYTTRPYAVLWIGTPIADGGPPDHRAPSKATRWPP